MKKAGSIALGLGIGIGAMLALLLWVSGFIAMYPRLQEVGVHNHDPNAAAAITFGFIVAALVGAVISCIAAYKIGEENETEKLSVAGFGLGVAIVIAGITLFFLGGLETGAMLRIFLYPATVGWVIGAVAD